MRRLALFLLAAAVLGGGCTEDRPAARSQESPRGTDEKPRCTASPGQPPEGFVLARSREFEYPDRIGVREDYRHPDGRLLVYLMGVGGQVGEHATIADEVRLASGQRATIFGDGINPNWQLAWEGRAPCPQIAVVGNGFSRQEFESSLRDMGLLETSS